MYLLRLSGVRHIDYWLARFIFDLPQYIILMALLLFLILQPWTPARQRSLPTILALCGLPVLVLVLVQCMCHLLYLYNARVLAAIACSCTRWTVGARAAS